jgi:5-methylcytosine-specific restriction endonuclease McrA
MNSIQPNTTVLVLNSSFEPLNITSWKRAVVLLLKQKAQVLSKRVIRLLNYVKVPFKKVFLSKPTKSAIYRRDGNKCQYCSSTKNLTIDHIIPKSKGGDNSWENMCLSCSTCNTKKGDKFLEQTGMKLLKTPRAPRNKIEFALLENKNLEWSEYA